MKIDLLNLSAGYGADLVLRGVEFSLRTGEVLAVLGPNGCGKSTLLRTLSGLLRPRGGKVVLDGMDLADLSRRAIARKLAILTQNPQLPGDLTVGELVAFGRFPHEGGIDDSRGCEAVNSALRRTRLESMRDRHLSALSGGELQRVRIALTLAQEPGFLLLDEPASFLDLRSQFELVTMIREFRTNPGMAVCAVLHDPNLAARCADRMLFMKDGAIRFSGTPREVMIPEVLREIFGVESRISTGPDGIPVCTVTGCAD